MMKTFRAAQFRFRIRPACWAMVLTALLSGCAEDDMSDLKAFIARAKAQPSPPLAPLPDIRIVEPFIFKPAAGRDPFEPDEVLQKPLEVQVETGVRPDTLRAREELEGFELDTLRMVGTVRQDGTVWALVRTQQGTIHRVKVNNYIGKNYGRVLNILDNQVELVEIYADSTGVWRERKAMLMMVEGDKTP